METQQAVFYPQKAVQLLPMALSGLTVQPYSISSQWDWAQNQTQTWTKVALFPGDVHTIEAIPAQKTQHRYRQWLVIALGGGGDKH